MIAVRSGWLWGREIEQGGKARVALQDCRRCRCVSGEGALIELLCAQSGSNGCFLF